MFVMTTRPSNFGSINYSCQTIAPPRQKEIVDTFDYAKLLAAITTEWELAGVIAARIGMKGQHIGKKLSKLWDQGNGPLHRHANKTEIYWRLK